MRRSDLSFTCVAIFVAAGCTYKGPTALKQSIAAMVDASTQDDSADAQSPVKTSVTCDILHSENVQLELQALALEPTCPPRASIVEALNVCRTTPSGDVGIRIAMMHLVPASARINRCNIEARVELVHIDHAKAKVGTALGVARQGDTESINFVDVNGWKWDLLGQPTFFDFDGDGEPEILVSGIDPGAGGGEWQGFDWHEAWTFRSGAWKKYPPLASAHFSKIEDVDHDGRPDLRTRGAYEPFLAISGLGGSQDRIVNPIFVLHSLPNGSFSAIDSIAKKAANDACAAARPFPFSKSGQDLDQVDALTLACVRMQGASQDDTLKKLSTSCKAYFSDVYDNAPDHCPAWAKQIAATTPPLSLKP